MTAAINFFLQEEKTLFTSLDYEKGELIRTIHAFILRLLLILLIILTSKFCSFACYFILFVSFIPILNLLSVYHI